MDAASAEAHSRVTQRRIRRVKLRGPAPVPEQRLSELLIRCYDAHLSIRVDPPELLERLRPYLPPGWQPSTTTTVDCCYVLAASEPATAPSADGVYVLSADGQRLTASSELDQLLRVFEADVRLCVAVRARRWFFVHAGVVGWRGHAVVIPGSSWAGKTRLVHALVHAGATYYSDECAALDEAGHVHPYAKPLTIRSGDGQPKTRCSAEDLGGQTGVVPLPVGLVAVATYVSGAAWRPRQLTPAETTLALFEHTIRARLDPRRALKTLARVALSCRGQQGIRGEADTTVEALLSTIENIRRIGSCHASSVTVEDPPE